MLQISLPYRGTLLIVPPCTTAVSVTGDIANLAFYPVPSTLQGFVPSTIVFFFGFITYWKLVRFTGAYTGRTVLVGQRFGLTLRGMACTAFRWLILFRPLLWLVAAAMPAAVT
jgi:hypothetical protein